ncbi:superoxide dismutase, partial [Bacteroidales bacterium OttesenSCG-928-A17]|nr:superoxide dismutase [Bacteroidales bacterium OttesenSCG-928-A17]
MKFEISALPYANNALEPVISQQTIDFHWGKHAQAYLNNLNKLAPGTPFEDKSLEDIIRKADGAVFNNAAQVWNHVFYFTSFSAKRGTKPSPDLSKA